MKGLLLKDAYTFAKQGRYLFFIELLFLGIYLFAGGSYAIALNPFFIFSVILPLSMTTWLNTTDEIERWPRYACSLPCTRKQIVTARYLTSGCAAVLFAGIAAAAHAIRSAVAGGFSPRESAEVFLFLFCAGMVAPLLSLPLLYRFGSEKARVFLLVIFAVLFGILIGTLSIAERSAIPNSVVKIAALPAVLLLWVGSWALSVRIYRKREL